MYATSYTCLSFRPLPIAPPPPLPPTSNLGVCTVSITLLLLLWTLVQTVAFLSWAADTGDGY